MEASLASHEDDVTIEPTSKMATAVNNTTTCHFFRLSAELRNHIYRAVLVEKENIPIDTGGNPRAGKVDTFAQPGILQTCTQVRQEACSIYYLENSFTFELRNLDTNKLICFCIQADDCFRQTRDFLDIDITTGSSNKVDWYDFDEYLRAFHHGEAPRLGCRCELPGPRVWEARSCCLLSRMVELVEGVSPQSKSGVPWSVVESMLEASKDLINVALELDWRC